MITKSLLFKLHLISSSLEHIFYSHLITTISLNNPFFQGNKSDTSLIARHKHLYLITFDKKKILNLLIKRLTIIYWNLTYYHIPVRMRIFVFCNVHLTDQIQDTKPNLLQSKCDTGSDSILCMSSSKATILTTQSNLEMLSLQVKSVRLIKIHLSRFTSRELYPGALQIILKITPQVKLHLI